VVVRGYPDTVAGRVLDERFIDQFYRSNMVIHDRLSQVSHEGHRGNLSIKCAFGGQEHYQVRGRSIAVDDSCYLVLNAGEWYNCSIYSPTPVESFCLFFRPSLVEEVMGSLLTPVDRDLDEPAAPSTQPVQFLQRLHAHDPVLTPKLLALRAAVRSGRSDLLSMEEQFHFILEALLAVHRSVYQEVDAVPALRHATRQELYRRLHQARDFIHSDPAGDTDLEAAARVACMSKHHFLRLFKQVFGETPHQFRTRRRLEIAQRLLRTTEWPVVQIGLEVGFENPGSLSRLFRTRLGVSPEQYRRSRS